MLSIPPVNATLSVDTLTAVATIAAIASRATIAAVTASAAISSFTSVAAIPPFTSGTALSTAASIYTGHACPTVTALRTGRRAVFTVFARSTVELATVRGIVSGEYRAGC